MIQFFYDSYLMFIQFLIPGVFLGIIYDVFYLIRIGRNNTIIPLWQLMRKRYFSNETRENIKIKIKKFHFDAFFIFIEDISFFLIVAITEILAIYHLNNGEIRIYSLLFSLIGFFCYQKTIGLFVIFLARNILRLLKKYLFIFICSILHPCACIIKKSKKMLFLNKIANQEENKNVF